MRAILRNILLGFENRANRNGAPSFVAPLTSSLILERGIGLPTFTRASTATQTDFEGNTHQALSGEVRFQGARRVRNLLTSNSNQAFGAQSETSPAPTNGVALTDAPYGVTAGFQYASGCTGITQHNVSIPADNNWYIWSVMMYVVDPATAVFCCTSQGISGISADGVPATYTFSTMLGNIGLLGYMEDLGGGYYRYSSYFKNTGAGTLYINRLDGGVVGMDKLIFFANQLLCLPSTALNKRTNDYVPYGTTPYPYLGAGYDGAKNDTYYPAPFSQVRVWGDSIPGAGASGDNKWYKTVGFDFWGPATGSSVGGYTTTQIRSDFLAATTTPTDIVILEGGVNNAVLATVVADYAAMVSAIPHDHFIIIGLFQSNTNYYGTDARANIDSINAALRSSYPNNFLDVYTPIVNASSPAYSGLGVATPIVYQGDGGTDIIHPTDAAQLIVAKTIKDYMIAKGWMHEMLPIPAATLLGYLSEGSATNYFLNSGAPVTQTISLPTGTFTLGNILGSGSITSSAGTATATGYGVATASATNTITVTVAGTVVFTVAGTVTQAQVENTVFATSYIPTAGTAVTRAADALSYPTAGNILAASFTLYFEFTPNYAPAGRTVFLWASFTNSTNYTDIYHDSTNLIFRKFIAGVGYLATIPLNYVAGTTYKIAVSSGASGTNIAVGGVVGTPNANTVIPLISASVQVLADGSSARQPVAQAKNERLWQTQLPNLTLQAITTP